MPETTVAALKQHQNLFEAIAAGAERWPDRTAVKGEGGQGFAYTYAELLAMVRRLAAALQQRFPEPATEIGLLSANCAEWPVAYLAIVSAGHVVVPLDANLNESELASLISQARLKVVIASDEFESLLKKMSPSPQFWPLDRDHPQSFLSIACQIPLEQSTATRNDTAALIYTSGTTGSPKAVILTHGNLLENLTSIKPALQFGPDDVFLSVLPLHHTFEATCGFLCPLTSGATVVYARSLRSKDILEDIGNNGVTCMCGVPLLYEKMYHSMQRKVKDAPVIRRLLFKTFLGVSAAGWGVGAKVGRTLFTGVRKRAGLESLRLFISGGAALPPAIGRQFNLMGLTLLQGYGLTETAPVVSVNRPDNLRFASVGPPLDGVDIRIDNPDSEGVGEILIRGRNVTPGYKNNPEATAEILRDGWFCSGDLGRLHDGHLWITGRAKNLIVSAAGKNIYPEQIEEKLLGSLFVMEALVIGRPKAGKQGEEIHAVLVPDLEHFAAELGMSPQTPDDDLVRSTIAQIVSDTNASMSDYKRISSFVVQYEELEKTSTKKVKRFLYQ